MNDNYCIVGIILIKLCILSLSEGNRCVSETNLVVGGATKSSVALERIKGAFS